MRIKHYSIITFEENATTMFYNNIIIGRLVYCALSALIFKENSEVIFHNNKIYGHTIFIADYSSITFEGNSTVTFDGNSTVTFDDNNLYFNGGAMFTTLSEVTFKGNCEVAFHNTVGINSNGGTVYIDHNSNITFEIYSTVIFNHNEAGDNGGTVYGVQARISFKGNSKVVFEENVAKNNGGAIYIDNCDCLSQNPPCSHQN